jgi:hypothetical protein
MQELLLEFAVEAASVLGYTVVFSVLTGLGLLAEYVGFERLTGDGSLGYWFLAVGALAIIAGAMFAKDVLVPRLRTAKDRIESRRAEADRSG